MKLPSPPSSGEARLSGRGLAVMILLPAALLVGLSVVVRVTDLDRQWMQAIFDRHGGFLTDANWYCWLTYHLGTKPALTLSVGGLLGLLASIKVTLIRPWRRWMTLAVFTMLLGPGLLVNAIFKDHYGRPRPVQTEQFGGSLPFRAVGEMGIAGKGRAFPSGHASMGYYLMFPFFALLLAHPRWAWGFLGLGIAGGLIVGYGRMLMGGHWPTDVLWSGGMVYFSGLIVAVACGLLPLERRAFRRHV